MGLTEDILSMIGLIFFFLIAGIVLTNSLLSSQSKDVKSIQTEYLYDYYSTSVNSFFNLREPATGVPMHILIADYISSGDKNVIAAEGSIIDIEQVSGEILDEFFGEDNYYIKITQALSDTTISFVFVGSPNVELSRNSINESMDQILSAVETYFLKEGAAISVNIYVLSGEDDETACKDFVDNRFMENCHAVGFDELYNTNVDSLNISPPNFGHESFEEWNESKAKAIKQEDFFESDWLSGVAYAEKEFRKNSEREEFHIIIPVFAQLSTSSVADECFNINKSGSTAYSDARDQMDYIVCRLCNEECPVLRAEVPLENITRYLKQRANTVLLPIYSFRKDFTYYKAWNSNTVLNLTTNYYRKYVTFNIPEDETLCHYGACPGCNLTESVTWSSGETQAWFKTDCRDEIENQMNRISNATGGESISITNIGELSGDIIDNIKKIMSERYIDAGSRDAARTRYVYERVLVLPSGSVDVYLQVYETPLN